MSELATHIDARGARAVAGQIRQGIRDYLSTLALVKRAWDEEHWRILGYDAWQDYIDSEFGADRLGLPLEHRDKALNDLRLSGMSVRAIAATTGVPKSTVADELNRLSGAGQLEQPDAVRSLDGRERPATRPTSPTGSGATAPGAAPQPDRSGPEEVEPASEGGCGSTSSSDHPHPAASPAAQPEANGRLPRPGAGSSVEAGGPTSPVEEFVSSDPAVQAAEFMKRFAAALHRGGDYLEFDEERVATLADPVVMESIARRAELAARFAEKVSRARSGLRLMKGGLA